MIANCAKFGWSWEVVPEEPWHIRYCDGDAPSDAVKAWMDANPAEVCAPGAAVAAPAPKPAATPAAAPQSGGEAVKRGKANAASNPVLQVGSKGAAVRTLQQLLNKAGVKCATDGDFGPKTEQAVKEFQKKVGLAETGIVENKTWAKINP
jgi:murein L,D-transpeptidase YcbB/YkuD